MSTRSKVAITDGTKSKYYWHHWDGYPDNMIPVLTKLIDDATTFEEAVNHMQADRDFEPISKGTFKQKNLWEDWIYEVNVVQGTIYYWTKKDPSNKAIEQFRPLIDVFAAGGFKPK